jgi:hypothetical protein
MKNNSGIDISSYYFNFNYFIVAFSIKKNKKNIFARYQYLLVYLRVDRV